MKTKILIILVVVTLNLKLQTSNCFSQGVAINASGNPANVKSLLDVDADGMSSKAGLLIPRMTTAERDAISATPPTTESLLIYNTTTHCFEAYYNGSWVAFGCIGCTVPTAVTVSAAANPICVGSTLNLTGGATNATAWNWTGPNSYTSTSQSPTIAGITVAGVGVYTLAASNNCGSVTASTASVTVNAAPTTAAAGSDINPACGVTTATLAGNNPGVGTGEWTVVSGTATITNSTLYNSGVTALSVPGVATLRWTISNSPCTPSTDDVIITTTSCGPTCGTPAQVWMAANMNTGAQVTEATTQTAGQKWCYNDVVANCTTYGGLYQWASAMNLASSENSVLHYGVGLPNCDPCGAGGVQGICPSGYHIPTDLEWSRYEYCIENNIAPTGSTTLATFQTTVGFRGSATAGVGPGDKMKVTSSNSPAWDGTNTSGFSALPAGYSGGGTSSTMGTAANFWSVTEFAATNAWLRQLGTGGAESLRSNPNKAGGFSVRCLQN